MALHGTVEVNGHRIGMWSARRVAPLGQPRPDDTCLYEWSWVDDTDPKPVRGDVRHRYGDGAVSLAQTVLSAVMTARAA